MKSEFNNETDELIEKTTEKGITIVINILFAFAISIFVLLLFSSNFNIFFMGNIPTFSTAIEAVVFLAAWLLYGMAMGYMKRKSFMKFISFYWGISGLIFAIGFIASRNWSGVFPILAIPVTILSLAPTYGLKYFINVGSHQLLSAIMCITVSWSSGVIGYLLGYLLNKLRVSTVWNK